ncbi:hypothetical protein F7725_011211 [Dissostichus mawsoni]|uniref:Uncharacterized protein n=1 Tax=Dissostichus mawsoni TaxID=36200 RepID=A0A7J5Z8S2_DISMA|nr:hypothetical protein F7725_011211 [Dissostichus mawsoni]
MICSYLGLHHGRPLGAKRLHRLEEVDHSFVPHPLQHDAERDEDSVYSDWSILSKLFLGFVHLSNEINEAFSSFWHSLFGPVSELELADCSGLSILTQHTLASVTLNSLRMYWGMLYSAMGSTTKYWYLAERSAGQY